MRTAVASLLLVIVAALWIANSYRTQQQVGPDDATVQAQTTAVARVVPSPTP